MYFQRWLRDWFRVVLPHEGIVIGIVVLYLMTDVIQLLDALMEQLHWGGPNQVALPRENEIGAVLAIISAAIYGGFRVAFFHPLFRKDYREWLQTSPWSLGYRLPLGPVHVVWQDVFVLGVLALATLRMPEPAIWAVPLVFLLAYVFVSMLPLLITGEAALAFVIALLLGGMGRWAREPLVVAALLAAVYGLCFLGLRRSLARVHGWDLTWWNDQGLSDIFSKNMASLADTNRKKILGWPHDRLSLRKNETPVSFPVGLCVSLLIGWWLHAVLHHFAVQAQRFGAPGPHPMAIAAGLVMPCLLLAGVRTGIYAWGYAPPIGVLARLVTFRWLIPSYDKVFIAPATIVVLALYGPYAASQMGVAWEYGVPLILGLMLLVALTMGPGLDEWRLTGGHRIVPAMQTQQNELMES